MLKYGKKGIIGMLKYDNKIRYCPHSYVWHWNKDIVGMLKYDNKISHNVSMLN